MRSHAPFQLIEAKFCVRGRVADIIICAIFLENAEGVSEIQDPEKRRLLYLTSYLDISGLKETSLQLH